MAEERTNWKQVVANLKEGKATVAKKAREAEARVQEWRQQPVKRAFVDSSENFAGGFSAKLVDNLTGDMLPEWAPGGLVVAGITKAYAVSEMERKAKAGEEPGFECDLDALAAGMFGGEGYALANKISDGVMAYFKTE